MFRETWLKFSNRLSCLYKHGQSPLNLRRRKCNTSNVILCPAELPNFWYKLLMLTMSAYCFTHAFHSHGICQEFEKKWTGRIVSNSLLLQEVTCCYKRLWKFSVTEPLCYKDVFVNSFCSPTFRLANSLVVEPFIWLII